MFNKYYLMKNSDIYNITCPRWNFLINIYKLVLLLKIPINNMLNNMLNKNIKNSING